MEADLRHLVLGQLLGALGILVVAGVAMLLTGLILIMLFHRGWPIAGAGCWIMKTVAATFMIVMFLGFLYTASLLIGFIVALPFGRVDTWAHPIAIAGTILFAGLVSRACHPNRAG